MGGARGAWATWARTAASSPSRYGSWVLLATLVLDAEVDAYAEGPLADRCGSCRLCLMSCPTGALVGNGRVDARACLSYQTIENREREVPESFRPEFDDLVFGCDICQDVCPLNRKPVFAEHARFAAAGGRGPGQCWSWPG